MLSRPSCLPLITEPGYYQLSNCFKVKPEPCRVSCSWQECFDCWRKVF